MDKFFRLPFAVTGDKTAIPDPAQPTGSVSYAEGFGADYEANPGTDPDAKDVPRDETNQLFYDVTNAIREIQSFGTPDFITSALNGGTPYSYSQGARVKWTDGFVYESRINSNTTDPLSVANWGRVNTLGMVASFLINGYLKIPFFDASTNQPREIIIQWGRFTSSNTSDVIVNFNIPFPTECLVLNAFSYYTPGTGTGAVCSQSAGVTVATPRESFAVRSSLSGIGSGYIAIGY